MDETWQDDADDFVAKPEDFRENDDFEIKSEIVESEYVDEQDPNEIHNDQAFECKLLTW